MDEDAHRAVLQIHLLTFFLQTSDHGAQLPFGKWNLYDEGTREPLLSQFT
jgi:hypothetical protein